jgi:O-antigen ligase
VLAFAAIMLAFAFYIFIFNRAKSLRFTIYMSILACILTASCLFMPSGANRLFATIHNLFNKEIKTLDDTKKSGIQQLNEYAMLGRIDARTQVWISAVEVIRERPVFGVGTGDIKTALMTKYIKHDFPLPQKKHLNAHNQFLQVAVTLGFVGLAVFLAFLVFLFWLSWKKRSILLFLLGLLGVMNFWTESIFEKQIGVMFFAFFFTFLCYVVTADLLENRNEQ